VDNGLLGLHQAHDDRGRALNWEEGATGTGKFERKPAYITDDQGNKVYKEATITIFEGNFDEENMDYQRTINDDPSLSIEEAMVATFAHEGDHDLNQQAIDAIRDRHEGRNNRLDVERPAERVEANTYREIKSNRNNRTNRNDD
jgi:hypothetical protein